MTTIDLSTTIEGANPRRDNSWMNLILLCVWAIVGLAFTGLSFAVGFGAQVAEALAAAG
jgi:hypothetical protein